MKKIIFAALAACFLPCLVFAQLKITGTVSDNSTLLPLPDVTIRIKETNKLNVSDKNGIFEFNNLKPGIYTLTLSHIGYKLNTQVVEIEANKSIQIKLIPTSFIAEEVLVQSTRVGKQGVSTFKNISKSEIENQNFGQDLPFLIQNTPGVVVTSDAGAGVGYTGIRIRGSDPTRVNVTINGIPYNDSESQGTFWVNMPDFASSIDNIQIQRGLGTSTNGAGSFGGSVNILTSSVSDLPFVSTNNSIGSFGTLKNTIKLGTGLIGNFSFEGRLSRIKSDGFIDRSKSDLQSYFVSGAFKTDKEVLRVNVFGGKEQTYQAWNGIPEAKLRGNLNDINDYINRNGLSGNDALNIINANPRTYNSFLYEDQNDNYWQKHYQALYAVQLNDNYNLNLAAHYTDGKGYFEEFKENQKLSNYGIAPVLIGNTTIERSDLVRRRWLDNDFYGITYSLNFKNDKLSWTIGGAYNEYLGDHFGEVIKSNFGNVINLDNHYYDNRGTKKDFNVYGKLNFNVSEKFNLFGDLQYRNINYRVVGTDKNRNQLFVKDDLNFFNPKFGLNYILNSNQHLYTSLSFAKKEPNRDDYINFSNGFTPLPEGMTDLEIGYRANSKNLDFGINGYGMWYKDQLIITGKINEVGEYFRQNVPKSYRIGIEADVTYTLNSKFKILANAAVSQNKINTYIDYSDDYDNGGQVEEIYKNTNISFSPSTIIGSELVYIPLKNLALSFQSKYVGKQYLDNTEHESRSLNSHFVNHLRMGYSFSIFGIKNIQLGLLINNLFDIKYESNGYTFGYYYGGKRITENFYFPQAGRHVITNLNINF